VSALKAAIRRKYGSATAAMKALGLPASLLLARDDQEPTMNTQPPMRPGDRARDRARDNQPNEDPRAAWNVPRAEGGTDDDPNGANAAFAKRAGAVMRMLQGKLSPEDLDAVARCLQGEGDNEPDVMGAMDARRRLAADERTAKSRRRLGKHFKHAGRIGIL
jgi:hypothetical protein